jgi:hypothetical protein
MRGARWVVTMYERLDHLFTLRLRLLRGEPSIVIRAFDANVTDKTGHCRIDVEVRHGGAVIFPRGALWCGVSRGTTVDGVDARELVLATIGMKPGDTDADYFASYTPEQLAWAEKYGEDISYERERRYCDENGAVRRPGRKVA